MMNMRNCKNCGRSHKGRYDTLNPRCSQCKMVSKWVPMEQKDKVNLFSRNKRPSSEHDIR